MEKGNRSQAGTRFRIKTTAGVQKTIAFLVFSLIVSHPLLFGADKPPISSGSPSAAPKSQEKNKKGIDESAETASAQPGQRPVKEFQIKTDRYEIAVVNDYSRGQVVILSFRVVLADGVARETIPSIAREIIDGLSSQRALNALEILFYEDPKEIDGPFTVAGVQWAPFGKPEHAGEAAVGDYSKHEMNIIFAPSGKEAKQETPEAAPHATPDETPGKDKRSLRENDIRKLLEDWKSAWETKSLDTYLSFYSPYFRSEQGGLESYRKAKKSVFERESGIRVTLADIRIESTEAEAVVTFEQQYESSRMSDLGTKILYLTRMPDGWKIVREEWEPSPAAR